MFSCEAVAPLIAGTLAGASGQSVDTLLDRVGSRRQRALAAKVHPPAQALVTNIK